MKISDWFIKQITGRPIPVVEKTADDVRIGLNIHDKEIELTYLRQGAKISGQNAKEARIDLRSTLRDRRRRLHTGHIQ